MNQYEFTLLLLSSLSGLAAAFFLFKLADMLSERNKKAIKLRLQNSLYENKKRFENFLFDPVGSQLFRDAGYPFGITLIKYQYFRYLVTLLLMFWIVVVNLVVEYSGKGLLMGVSGLVFFFIVTKPEKIFPVGIVLANITLLRTTNKNRELFMLYSMVADEIQTSKTEARNMYNLLLELRDYCILIRPALDLALARWRKESHDSFEVLAKEIGTPEAHEFVKLLQDIGKSDLEKAQELISERQSTFINAQRENKRRRLKVYAYFGYVAAFLPIVCYGINVLTIAQMEVNYLTDLSNHYKR